MARMLRVAQRVDDPALDAVERLERRVVEAVDVARIGERAETEAERADAAVSLPEALYRNRAPCPYDLERPERLFDHPRRDDGRIAAAFRLHEAIAEAREHALSRGIVHVDVDLAAHVDRDHAQVVEAVELVGVVVGD